MLLITNILFIEQNVRSLEFHYWIFVFYAGYNEPGYITNDYELILWSLPKKNVLYNELLPKDKQE